MPEPRLTSVSHVVLGVVALRGETTSYELKRYVATSIGHFWPIPHAQLYREPNRLTDLGLLTARDEESGRRRRFFAVTPAGREALDTWLADPIADTIELRDAGLSKLHFAELMRPGARAALANAQVALRERRLHDFEDLRSRYGDDDSRELLTLEMGIALERAALAFWRSLAES